MFARMDETGRAMAQSLQESPPTGLTNEASETGHKAQSLQDSPRQG